MEMPTPLIVSGFVFQVLESEWFISSNRSFERFPLLSQALDPARSARQTSLMGSSTRTRATQHASQYT
jgi:hypothetical protein